jgi:DNA mismatch endonuclease (patch repair protein)
MSGIKSKNTKPELMIRHSLFKNGFRYRLHCGNLPGKPDMVFRKYNAVVLIHGCFWHGHNCRYFVWPKSNADFWKAKINGNITNDKKVIAKLKEQGYRICVFWECVSRDSVLFPQALASLAAWLTSTDDFLEVSL